MCHLQEIRKRNTRAGHWLLLGYLKRHTGLQKLHFDTAASAKSVRVGTAGREQTW